MQLPTRVGPQRAEKSGSAEASHDVCLCSVLTALVHAFTSVVVLRQSPEEVLKSFEAVATTVFILLLLLSFAYNANHHHSAEPTYNLD